MTIKNEFVSVTLTSTEATIRESYNNTMAISFSADTVESQILNAIARDEDLPLEEREQQILNLAYLMLSTRLIISALGFGEKYMSIISELYDNIPSEELEETEEDILANLKALQKAKEVLSK